LVYLFELNESGYTCTITLALSDGVNKQILGRFRDVGNDSTFTRSYYKVVTEKELRNMKESTVKRLKQELGLDEINLNDNDIISSNGDHNLNSKVGDSHYIFDREYVYIDGILDEFRVSPTTKFIQKLSGTNKNESPNASNSIIALDLETRTIDNVLEVISAC